MIQKKQVIPYATLLRELELSDTRTLEDLIIEGMYAGLFKVLTLCVII